MAVTPLTGAELAAVKALEGARRIEQVPVDLQRAQAFMDRADERLGQLSLLTSDAVRYDLAYDAAHDVGEALLAAFGFRTVNGSGQHAAVGNFLLAVLTTPPGDRAARQFDRLRRARNQSHYQAVPIGKAQADQAAAAAGDLITAARSRGL